MLWENYNPEENRLGVFLCALETLEGWYSVSCLISFPHLALAVTNSQKAFRIFTGHSGPAATGAELTPDKHDPHRQELQDWNTEPSQVAPATLFIYFYHGPNVNVCLGHKMSHSHWLWHQRHRETKAITQSHTLTGQRQRLSGLWDKAQFSHRRKLDAWQEIWHQLPCWSQHNGLSVLSGHKTACTSHSLLSENIWDS